ncbi:helix-turn-helix domain-containing protein [Paenibacillus sp. ACRRX]|uniref:helix-turn-helix domain-containing protein n=1 Tax=Paenibacillus sp. ACRRX TaxID=2918206 RepID=UPI001EF6B0E2|nr:helix-turn-helix domain-containing protein [Paenibacillus sp. ACRRX]MCG7407757.1 helix-turn-helix domain-containing protein [Paenibacillus sp. ACRRX]
MYVDAVKSGLLADMGAEMWHTLCVIASYMNERGECYPTQAQIARGIGTSRTAASRRIKRLLDYRWNEKPIVTVIKKREGGVFDNNRYTVQPISGLAMFDRKK